MLHDHEIQQHMVIHHLVILFNEAMQQILVSMKIKLTIGIILFLDDIDITLSFIHKDYKLKPVSEMNRNEKNWTG